MFSEVDARRIGVRRVVIVIIKEELKIRGRFIAFTWICTKSFWFLRPAERLFSFKSRTSRGIEPRCEVISSSWHLQSGSVDKRGLTSVSRITI